MSSIPARRSLLASAAAFVLILLCTVVITVPSFAAGLTILLHGARGGVYLANNYPKNVHKQELRQSTAKNQSDQISLLEAQRQLHFQMYLPESLPGNYALDSMYLYQTADTPLLRSTSRLINQSRDTAIRTSEAWFLGTKRNAG
jgi:hypothetical protein